MVWKPGWVDGEQQPYPKATSLQGCLAKAGFIPSQCVLGLDGLGSHEGAQNIALELNGPVAFSPKTTLEGHLLVHTGSLRLVLLDFSNTGENHSERGRFLLHLTQRLFRDTSWQRKARGLPPEPGFLPVVLHAHTPAHKHMHTPAHPHTCTSAHQLPRHRTLAILFLCIFNEHYVSLEAVATLGCGLGACQRARAISSVGELA